MKTAYKGSNCRTICNEEPLADTYKQNTNKYKYKIQIILFYIELKTIKHTHKLFVMVNMYNIIQLFTIKMILKHYI